MDRSNSRWAQNLLRWIWLWLLIIITKKLSIHSTIKPPFYKITGNRYPELKRSSWFQIQPISLIIIICLRLYCPALPADTGHSDGCAAANWGASGDGLRPAGADTPGSGVTAALCQCHDSVTAYEFACYNQGCCFFSWPISVLFGSSSLPPSLPPASMSYSCLNCMFLSTVCHVSTSGFRLCSHGCRTTSVSPELFVSCF